jgi:hypothetical protein
VCVCVRVCVSLSDEWHVGAEAQRATTPRANTTEHTSRFETCLHGFIKLLNFSILGGKITRCLLLLQVDGRVRQCDGQRMLIMISQIAHNFFHISKSISKADCARRTREDDALVIEVSSSQARDRP